MILRSGLVVLLLLLVGGCGEDEPTRASEAGASASSSPTAGPSSSLPSSPSGSASASADPAAADLPGCAEVWREGASLPRRYAGCADGGRVVRPDRLSCSSGQAIERFDERFWGVAGGTIHRAEVLDEDPAYRADVAACRG